MSLGSEPTLDMHSWRLRTDHANYIIPIACWLKVVVRPFPQELRRDWGVPAPFVQQTPLDGQEPVDFGVRGFGV